MTVNILIGIGGTGAKVVESALYLLASGVGPDDRVLVGIVDQDNGNGNVARTLELVERIRSLRAHFSPPRANILDWNAAPEAGGTTFLKVPVEPLMGRTAHWRPADDSISDLADILQKDSMSDGEKALFDLLFRNSPADSADAEQNMGLSEGYRGRAHVGAAALLSAFHFDETSFRDRMRELMGLSLQGQDVRIFLAGSLFGGTGAAGFPTIARTLHSLRQEVEGQPKDVDPDRVFIGGVLMLPYFSFQDAPDRSANVVRSNQLLPQARTALAFYENLFSENTGVFDRLHIAGWDKLFPLPYHSPGRNEQNNPALLPELLGAVAAVGFLSDPVIARETGLQASARADSGAFRWDDLPASPELKQQLYRQMGSLLRFAYYWRYSVEPAFDNRGGGLFASKQRVAGNIKLPWLKELAANTDWQLHTPEARADLLRFIEGLLLWAGSIQLFARDVVGDFGLWNCQPLMARADSSAPADPIDLHEARSSADVAQDFTSLVRDRDPQKRARDASALYAELHEKGRRLPDSGSQQLGRVVWAVHRAARPFETGA